MPRRLSLPAGPIGGGLRWSATAFLLGFPLLVLADGAAAQPVVTISADMARVTEGMQPVFRIQLDSIPTETIRIQIEITDSGNFATVGGTGIRQIPLSAQEASLVSVFSVATVDDNTAEEHGTITAAVRSGTGYTIGTQSEAVTRVSDNDITASLSLTGGTPLSEGGRMNVNIQLAKALDGNQTLTLPLALGGTATRGTDYRLSCESSTFATCNGINGATPSITFHGAELNKRTIGNHDLLANEIVWFEAIEDNTTESNETVTLSLGGGPVTTITLQDAPSSVTLSFFRDNYTGGEGDGLMQPVFQVDTAPGQNIVIPFTFTNITATEGQDYLAVATATFLADGRTRQSVLHIPVLDDTLYEGDETFRIEIDASGLPDWVTVGSQSSMVMTIEEDDQVVVTISADTARVTEGTSMEFTVSTALPPQQPLDVTVEVTDSGNFAASGTGTRTVTVGTDGTGTLTVTTTDDNTTEEHGTITAVVRSGSYDIGSVSEAVVKVSDDDITATMGSNSGTSRLSEGGRTFMNIILNKALDGDQTLPLPLALGGTATRGTDYRLGCGASTEATCNGIDGATPSITFHGAELNKKSGSSVYRWERVLWLEAIEDDTAESNETVTLSLGGGSVRTMTLQDAPSSVTLSFVLGTSSSVGEDGLVQPTLQVDTAPGQDIVVPLTFTDITATEGEDYTALATWTFPRDGRTRHTVDIPLLDDKVYEGDETFRVEIDASGLPDWVTVGSQSSAVMTIIEDDQVVVTISADTARVTEGTSATFTVRSTPAPQRPLDVTVEVTDSGDFAASGTGTQQVTVGTNGTGTLTVTTTDDNTAEEHGTITAVVRSGSYDIGSESEVVVKVSDNDITATLDVASAGVASLPEGARPFMNIELAKALDGDQTLTLPLALGGAATRGTDYRLGCESSTLVTCNSIDGATPSITFHGAELNKRDVLDRVRIFDVLWLEVIEDDTAESNETVTLSLGGGRVTTITLKDAPSSVTLSFFRGNFSYNEGVALATPTLQVDTAPGQDIVIPLTFTDITATEGEDYTALATWMFPRDGRTRWTLGIPLLADDDNVYEGDRTFRVEIDASGLPDWVTVGSQASAVITIKEDEQVVVTISADTARVTEGTSATFTVSTTPAPQPPLDVTVEVTDSGNFAASGTGTQTVTVGTDGTGTLTVTTTDDNTAEDHGTITAVVRSGSYDIGSASEAVVKVSDDDITTELVVEGGTPLPEGARVPFNIVLSKALDGDQTLPLPLALGGTATRGTDYRLGCESSTLITCNGIDGATPSITFHGAELNNPDTSNDDDRVAGVLWLEAIEDNTVESNETVTLSLGGGSVTTLTLNDAPSSVTLSFFRDSIANIEGLGVLAPVLQVDAAPGQAITVPLVYTDITATEGEDYTAAPTGTFPADGSTRSGVNILILDDKVYEGDETFRLEIDASGLPDWVTVGSQSSALVTIQEDEQVVVTISADTARVTEGTSATFTVSTTPAPRSPLDVTVEVTDSGNFAASGTGTQTVTVGTDGTGTLTVTTTDDNTAEDHGTITAVVRSGSYDIGSASEAVVKVSDDDIKGTLVLAATGVTSLPEGGRTDITTVLAKALDGDQTLTLPLALGGTATRGTDYRLGCESSTLITCNGINGATPSITFHGAELNNPDTSNDDARVSEVLWLESIEDNTVESNETVTLSLGGGRVITLTLKEAPSSVTLSFFRSSTSSFRERGSVDPILQVDTAPGQDIVVPLVYTDITATEGEDYTALATVTFPRDGRTRWGFGLPILQDNVYEGDETFRVEIDASGLPDGVTVGSQTSVVGTITDDEQVVVTISADTARVTEGTSATFTVSASPAPRLSPLDVTVEVTDSGNFAASGGTGTQTVTVGTDGTGTLTVTTTDDNRAEKHGTITAVVDSGSYDIGAPSEAVVKVSDNDFAATLILNPETTSLPEGVRITLHILLAKTLDDDQTLTLPLLFGGTATRGTDYRLGCNTSTLYTCNGIDGATPSITLHGTELNKEPAGLSQRRARNALWFEVIEDNMAESNEMVTLSLRGGPVEAIIIKEAPSSVTLSFFRDSISSLTESGNLQPILQVDTAPGQDIVVPLVYTDITATEGEDYTAVATWTLPANGKTRLPVGDVPILEDNVYEGDETFRIEIDASGLPDWVTVGSQASTVVTIPDDETTPQVSFDSGTYSVTEGGQVSITVSIDQERSTATTVPISYADVSASSSHTDSHHDSNSNLLVNYGKDYEVGPAEVVIPAAAGGSATFTVQIVDDGPTVVEVEEDETFRVSLGTLPEGFERGTPSTTTVTIMDDEPDLSRSLLSGPSGRVLSEGGRVAFSAILGRFLDGDQRLLLPLVTGGTATRGTDYRLGCRTSTLASCNDLNGANPSIIFYSAELNKQEEAGNQRRVYNLLSLEAVEDNTAESNETITLSLGNGIVTRLRLQDAPSLVTLSFFKDNFSSGEQEELFQPLLQVDTAPGQEIVVPLTFTDITATEGEDEDYVALATTTFPNDGSTRISFDIDVVDDNVYEGDETFRVEIDTSRLPNWVRTGSHPSALLTIVDNEGPLVSLDSGTYSVTEGGQVSITVSIDLVRSTATTVPINYEDISASSHHNAYDSNRGLHFGQDYRQGPAEVVIPAEAGGSHTFTVQTVDDSATIVQEEADETFQVSLGELPAGIGKGAPSTATVTILDDDVRDPAPRVSSIERFIPLASPTDSNTLTWRVKFSEDVQNVDVSDFSLSGTTATLSTSRAGTSSLYSVVASGGDLADLNGTVVLGFATNQNIVDTTGNKLVNTSPTGANEDRFVVINTAALTVVITGGSAITEGGDAVFTLTANPAPPLPLEVTVTVTQTGDVVANDNLLGSRTVIIPATGSMTHTVATVDDTNLEENGRVTVTVDSGDYTVGDPSTASVTVHDNDDTSPPSPSPTTPTITVRGGNPNPVTEGAGANFTVTATPPPLSPLEVTVTVTQTGNFVASGNLNVQTVTIPPSGSMTHTVATVDDTSPEANGLVRVTVSQGTGYTVGSLASAAVTVHDNDPLPNDPPPTAPMVTIMGGPSPITEGRAAAFTVSRSGPVTAPLTVLLRVRETTTDGQDFVATAQEGDKTVTIPSGAATAPYAVPTVEDNTDEPNGMVTVALNDSSVYLVGSPSAASVNVNDDDGNAVTPVVSIMGGGVITEGQDATFTVTALPKPPLGESISVNVAISDSGNFAVTGQSGSRSVTIDARGTARFTVSTQDDAVHEEHGRITATVAGGSGYRPDAGNGSASVTVEDDDPALVLSVSSLRVTEGASASYTIALDTRPTGDVTVAISGDAATDLTLTPTSLTFTPSNWNRPQRVTLTAPEDTDFIGDTIDLTHTASGADYGGLTPTVVTVTVVAAPPTEEAKAWQLRLGRTVSHQVVDALQDRLTAPPATGLQLIVAGEAITSAPPLAEHEGLLSKALGFDPLTAQALAEDSSFSLAPEQGGAAPRLAFWGQGAFSSFRGEEEEFSLDGSVTTLLLGADWSGQRWQGGAALSQSWGSGSYERDTDAEGEISSTVTGLFPYGRYALNPRLGLWAVAGYGWGQLSLNPDGPADDATPSTTMAMAALGIDGLLFDGGSEGITLSSTADVLTLNTSSEEVDGLESSEGSFSRLRLGIEAVRPFPLSDGASLLPSLELGIRQDSGDAESGFGMDLGAGILWQAPERGISGALKGRTLLTHAEENLQEQGLAVSFSWEPNPSKRGPSLSLSHAMGATAAGGMDALLNPTTFEGLDADPSSGQRFEAELAYGFPAHNHQLTLTPAVALALSPTSRNYSLLWSLAPYTEAQADPWQVSLSGERQEPNAAPSPVEHSLKLTFSNLF